MEIEEKYNQWKNIFLKYFIHEDSASESGNYIPLSRVDFVNKKGIVGDGTINLAHYLTWAIINKDEARIDSGLSTLKRLSKSAYNYYQNLGISKGFKLEDGFFLRDDIHSNQAAKFNLDSIRSGYSSGIERIDEDPCFSPFISQDQCWNLLPVLSYLNDNNYFTARSIGFSIFTYVVRHHHTIYNPYLSTILFENNYINPNVSFNDRIVDRAKHLKYKVKVKRGANNWYFAWGFRKALRKFGDNYIITAGFPRLFYKALVFLADRVYYPYISKLFKAQVKNTSYYCMGIGADAWYFGNVHKRLINKFNKSLNTEELFLPELVAFSKNNQDIKWDSLFKWLNSYPEPTTDGIVESPLTFMILYSLYKCNC